MADNPVARQRARADRVWSQRGPWDALYREAYEYAVPQRRPSSQNTSKRLADKIFDMTAAMSAMYFAGSLQRNLFPPGQEQFVLEAGSVARLALGPQGATVLDRELGKTAAQIQPFFLAGDWDTSVHEACIDVGVGTGAILPVKGTRDAPVQFVAIPFDDLAVSCDAWGKITFVSWRQYMSREAIIDGFPNGKFSKDFREAAQQRPYDDIQLWQDFYRLPNGRWRFVAYTDKAEAFHVDEQSRTQPIAVFRYYRVPGEAYGRGPLLLALPSIKTLNKAQELALKSAAIQMLGIWGYRAGGTFNPDTVSVGPGQFWPMQSTGGILGPDVSRIDPASGRLDVAKMVIGNLQDQIKASLYDMRLPEQQGTPKSASEIAARLQQKAETHIGAFGRLVREIMPVIVPRVAEILYEFGYLSTPLNVDQFLVAVSVRSPMAAALNADKLAAIASYTEMAAAIVGPQAVKYYLDQPAAMGRIAKGFQIDADLVPDEAARKKLQEEDQAKMVAAAAAQAAGIDPTKMAMPA